MKLLHEVPKEWGARYNNYTSEDIVNVAIPIFTGNYKNAKFSHFEFYENCIITHDNYDSNGKHWFWFKNDEMPKAKKMQGKNFYEYARIVEASANKETLTKIKSSEKEMINIILGNKNY